MTRPSRSTLSRVRGSAFALCVALVPALALPQSAKAQTADQVFEQGVQTYDRSDFARAAVLFQQSCDGGATSACSNLAVLYMTGRGVAVSDRALPDARFVQQFGRLPVGRPTPPLASALAGWTPRATGG